MSERARAPPRCNVLSRAARASRAPSGCAREASRTTAELWGLGRGRKVSGESRGSLRLTSVRLGEVAPADCRRCHGPFLLRRPGIFTAPPPSSVLRSSFLLMSWCLLHILQTRARVVLALQPTPAPIDQSDPKLDRPEQLASSNLTRARRPPHCARSLLAESTGAVGT